VVPVVIVLLALAALSAYHSLSRARALLDQAHTTIAASVEDENSFLSGGARKTASADLTQVSDEVTQADQDLRSSFGLSVFGLLPVLHSQRQGLLNLVDDLQSSAKTGGTLLHQLDALASASDGDNVSIPQLLRLQKTVASAHSQFASYNRPATGLWGSLGTAQREFDHEDTKLTNLLDDGDRAIAYALPFLGADGPRNYLVVGENNAEMRDQGATLSYSVLNTSNGAITETPGGSVEDIEPSAPVAGISIPAGTEKAFGGLDPTNTWQSTNATADFAFSGKDMQYMFADTAGTDVDGVIGIDVVALQALLQLTGPVTVPGIPEPITAQNATNVLLNQLYADLPPNSSQGPRHEEISAVASQVFHQLGTEKVDVIALARTLATEVGGRHLLLWDEVPQYQQTIRNLGASGEIDTDDPTRTFHIAVENATATKLDYFVNVAVSDAVTITPNGSATIKTAVKLTNHAPAGQPASYQLGPDGVNSDVPGEYVGRVLLWAPRGSEQKGSVAESGLRLAPEVDLPVLPGQSATATFETTIPNAIRDNELKLVFQPQPRLAPESLSVRIVASGTQTATHASLTKATTLSWSFTH
jgi:hypothetical protein